jgi:predicted PurR-regulated permease PerM
MTPKTPQADFLGWVATCVAAGLLISALLLHLIPAMFAGMLVFIIVHAAAPWFGRRFSGHTQKVIATVVLAALVVLVLSLGLMAAIGALHRPGNSLDQLWEKLLSTLNGGHVFLPIWITEQFPSSAEDLKDMVLHWLRLHSSEISLVGKGAGVVFAQVLIAMVIAAMIAIYEVDASAKVQPFAKSMMVHVKRFHDVFRDVVSAQLQIALINASLTAVFLVIVLPAMGIQLPLVKTLIVITAVVGMIPVIGNVISNALIVLLSASVSLPAAAFSLVFLIVLHKLEYFLNARIVGHRIDARAWELLLAILVMEAAFGLPGIAAAPIYYAYAKRALLAARWI